MNVELLDKALASALCPMFQAIVPVSSTIAVVTPFMGPKGIAASVVAGSVANLSMLGASATCPEVEIGPDPVPITDGCWEVDNAAICWIRNKVNPETKILGYEGDVKKIINVEPWVEGNVGPGTPTSRATLELTSGEIVYATSGAWPYDEASWYLDPLPGSTCISDGPEYPPVNPDVPDHIYIDESTNCTYIVKFEGFIQQIEYGPIQPVFQISGAQETRASGGRMGACFLDPVIHVSPPNGPGGPDGPRIPPIPVPSPQPDGPGGGVPWWAGPVLGGATGAALKLIGDALAEMSKEPLLPGSFTLVAPCDKDEDDMPLMATWDFPKQTYEERVIAHQKTILEVLQQHLDWKTPICKDEKPELEGDWRSITFISDHTSPYGKSRLRKRFRYRSASGWSNDALVDHWKDFVWESGPVIVQHSGASWGTPQVWASTADEGKRVIRHAAGEAGIDPDQVGRWTISGSRSARYGVPDTMRVCTQKGFYWITARDGSNGRPLVKPTPYP